jgi:hypothetical protein
MKRDHHCPYWFIGGATPRCRIGRSGDPTGRRALLEGVNPPRGCRALFEPRADAVRWDPPPDGFDPTHARSVKASATDRQERYRPNPLSLCVHRSDDTDARREDRRCLGRSHRRGQTHRQRRPLLGKAGRRIAANCGPLAHDVHPRTIRDPVRTDSGIGVVHAGAARPRDGPDAPARQDGPDPGRRVGAVRGRRTRQVCNECIGRPRRPIRKDFGPRRRVGRGDLWSKATRSRKEIEKSARGNGRFL